MAPNVNSALSEFMRDFVNLDRQQTADARNSRDWLLEKIANFAADDSAFPKPYHAKDIFFGSFHRRTKKRPLDDIDLISALTAEGSTYTTYSDHIRLNVHADSQRLLGLCHDDGASLNSKRVLNKFVDSLKGVAQYRRAEIGRDGEAAVISPVSYEWSFDVVPAFFTTPEADGRTFYLIPDGKGHWKKTDPRFDQQRIETATQTHGDMVLRCIRLMKYWNNRRTVPTVGSYALESMILTHYLQQAERATEWIVIELMKVLNTVASAILLRFPTRRIFKET
jgi:hypothetical protein